MHSRFAIHAVTLGLLAFAALADARSDRPLERFDRTEHDAVTAVGRPILPATETAEAEPAPARLFTAPLQRSTTDDPRRAHWQGGLLGAWSVQLDRTLLDRPRREQGLELPQRILADLPMLAKTRVLRLEAVYEESNGSFSRTGIVEGDGASLVALTSGPEGVIGRIHTDGRIYLIEADGSAADARISVIDPGLLPTAEPVMASGPAAPVPDVPMLVEGLTEAQPDAAREEAWGNALLGFYDIEFNAKYLLSDSRPGRRRVGPAMPVAGARVGAWLPLLEGPVVLKLPTVEQVYIDGIYTSYSGWIEGDEEGSLVTITIGPSGTLGRIHSQGWMYLIESKGMGKAHTLTVLGQLPPEAPRDPDPDNATSSSANQGVIRVLVLYSPAVAGQINTLAGNIVAEFNQSLGLSGVPSSNRLSLAGVQLVNDDFTTLGARCRVDVLNQLANRQGIFSAVDLQMTQTHADVALLVVPNRPDFSECEAGRGRIGGVAKNFNSSMPFALATDAYALGDFTAPHEIGHVLGGNHESGGTATPHYARGHRASDCSWQTVMGGYVQCPFDFNPPDPTLQTTKRLPRWSNPLKTYMGQPTGTASRNMAAALATQMPIVAAWGVDPPPPASPAWLNVVSQHCMGLNDVSWATSANADAYELHGSTNSAFTAPSLIYVGPYTHAFIDVGSSTWLRATACTGGSCSGFSPQDVANVWPGTCMQP